MFLFEYKAFCQSYKLVVVVVVVVFWLIMAFNNFSVILPGFNLRVRNKKLTFLFLNQTYVVGTQKNRLNETVLLITQNIC